MGGATDKAKLKAIYDQINQLEKSKVEVTEHVTYHEQYLLWALAGLLLAMFMLWLIRRRRAKKQST